MYNFMENTNRQRNLFAQYMQNTKSIYFDLNIKYISIFQHCGRLWWLNSAPDINLLTEGAALCGVERSGRRTGDCSRHMLKRYSCTRPERCIFVSCKCCAVALRKVEICSVFK